MEVVVTKREAPERDYALGDSLEVMVTEREDPNAIARLGVCRRQW